MREFKISQINPSTAFPMSVVVDGDLTSFALGKYYRDSVTEATLPPYTTPAPSGNYVLIAATTFEIVGNPVYNGKYTVYSPLSASDRQSSSFSAGKTTINANEVVRDVTPSDPPDAKTAGFVRNFSTYVISITPGKSLVIPPLTQNNTDTALDFIGRGINGWGEPYAQNFMDLMQNFAGPTPPAISKAVVGQQYYSTATKQTLVFDGTSWGVMNLKTFGTTYKHSQTVPSATWTITHSLGLEAPYIGLWNAFVNRDGAVKSIVPSSIVFTNANTCTITFTNPETGYFLIHQ